MNRRMWEEREKYPSIVETRSIVRASNTLWIVDLPRIKSLKQHKEFETTTLKTIHLVGSATYIIVNIKNLIIRVDFNFVSVISKFRLLMANRPQVIIN